MTSIDNRVVSVKFDNAGFQQKVAETQGSLDGLKKSMDFKGAGDGLGDITTGLNRINFGPLSVGIDGISTKLLAMATVAATVFSKLASQAMDAGARLVKSLTLTPVMDGFKEYNLNMESIQTILANTKSKGTTLNDVTAALDELNTYSDQTIYNFGQMTENIGKFTAAGVGLKESVASIKGFSNMAALSGANAQQAASGAYQLSQAMAAGTIKLQDWRSLEQSGIGGEQFQKAVFETGKAMGTLKGVPLGQTFEEWRAKGNVFRETLDKGWVTADVMSTTLNAMTGDLDAAQMAALGYSDAQIQGLMDMAKTAKDSATVVKTGSQLLTVIKESIASGWSESFRNIIGDFEQAKGLFTGLYSYFGGIISRSSDARNYVLKGWSVFGGRDALVASLLTGLKAVENIAKPIGQAFREFFPRKTVTDLIGFTKGLQSFTEKLVISEGTMAKVKNVFSAFFSTIKVGVTVVKGIFGVFSSLFGLFNNTGSPALGVLAGVGSTIASFNNKLLSGNIITGFFEGISSGIEKLAGVVSNFFAPAFDKIGSVLDGFGKNGIEGFGNSLDKITSKTFKMGETFDKIKDFFSGLFPDSGSKKAEGASKSLDIVEKSMSGVKSISEKLKDVWQAIADGFSSAFQSIKDAADSTVDALKSFWSSVTSIFSFKNASRVGDVAGLGILGGILYYLRKLVNDGLDLGFGDLINKVGGSIDALTGTLESMQKKIKADALYSIAKAILVIAVSVGLLSLIDPKRLSGSLAALVIGFTGLMATMTAMDNVGIGGRKFVAMAAGLTLLSGAILLLSIAMLVLSTLEWPALVKGLVGLAAVLLITAAASRIMGENSANMISTAIGLGILAGSLILLSLAIRVFDKLNPGKLFWGLTGIALTLAVLTIALRGMPDDVAMKSLGLAVFAFGLKVMAGVVEKFGSIGLWELVKGIGALAVVLVLLIYSLNLMPTDLLPTAAGLLVVAIALKVIASAVGQLGEMGLFNIVKGLGALAFALGAIVFAANAMTGALPGAAAIIVMAGALWVMAQVLEKIGKLSIGELAKGLIGIAAIFLILGVAGLVLAPVIPAIVALAIALGILGAAFLLIGLAAYAVAKAFQIFADSGTKGIAAFKGMLLAVGAAIPLIITGFVMGIIGGLKLLLMAIPTLVGSLVTALSAILAGIVTLIPKVMTVIGTFIESLALLIIEKTPIIVAAGFAMIMGLLQGIEANLPQIVLSVSNIITTFLTILSEKMPEIVNAGTLLIVSFVLGLTNNIPKIVETVTNFIVAMLNAIRLNLGKIITAGADLIIALITGIGNNALRIVRAGIDTVLKFIAGFANKEEAKKISDAGFAAVVGILDGVTASVKENAPILRGKAKELAGAIVEGFVPNFETIKANLLSPFTRAWDALKAKFEQHSPSKVSMRFGYAISDGFAIGMKNSTKPTVRATLAWGSEIKDAMESSIQKANLAVDGIYTGGPVITPVLDLSLVRSQSRGLDNILNASSITASVSYEKASAVSIMDQLSSSLSTTSTDATPTTQITFEQNNYSPEALSVNDIYRQTKSQIELVKQELNVS